MEAPAKRRRKRRASTPPPVVREHDKTCYVCWDTFADPVTGADTDVTIRCHKCTAAAHLKCFDVFNKDTTCPYTHVFAGEKPPKRRRYIPRNDVIPRNDADMRVRLQAEKTRVYFMVMSQVILIMFIGCLCFI